MSTKPDTLDRYLSFNGIDCDTRARELVAQVRDLIAEPTAPQAWAAYFVAKLAEAEHRGHDELYFVGSQVNALRELFAQLDDDAALEQLEYLEEACC